MKGPSREEYRDGFRLLLKRLLDHELRRGIEPVNGWLEDLIKRDATAAISGD